MFESLTDRLTHAFSRLRGAARLTERNVDEALEEVRTALLEADVHFQVVKELTDRVRSRAIGEEVTGAVSPGDTFIKIFHDVLVAMMTVEGAPVGFAEGRPTVILLAGLQGAGKTTTAVKLAVWLSKEGRQPLLVAADVQRPAAVDQLKIMAERCGVPVFHQEGSSPETIAEKSVEMAEAEGCDTIIVDTAGRLHIDDDLMQELKRIQGVTPPDNVYLVCDAMTGQDAVRSAAAFQETLPLTGVILTKLDGDSRGGAALSVSHVTGVPVRFIGVGEAPEDLQQLHPDRLASRILGMGDVVTLVEKAQEHVAEEEAEEQMRRMLKDEFTLEDFLKQLQTLQKMGSMKDILGHLPGMGSQIDPGQIDEKALARTEAVVLSMTAQERHNPAILNQSRKERIAGGSGTSLGLVNNLMKQFKQMRSMMKKMAGKGALGRMAAKATGGNWGLGDMNPALSDTREGGPTGSSSRETAKRRRAHKQERQRKKQARRRR